MIPSSDDVIRAFWQQGESDCATIANIKTAIGSYGIDRVFTAAVDTGNAWSITFRNGKQQSVDKDFIANLKSEAGFAPDINNAIQQQIYNYALFCFGVFVHNYTVIEECSTSYALKMIDRKGIDATLAYQYLGIPDDSAVQLCGAGGVSDPTPFESNAVYLLCNSAHAVFSAESIFDQYGTPTGIDQFLRLHGSSLLWATKFQ